MGMKVLIQKLETKEYFAGERGWVRDHETAQVFPSGAAALRCIDDQQLRPARILYKFPNAKYDFEVCHWPILANPLSQPA